VLRDLHGRQEQSSLIHYKDYKYITKGTGELQQMMPCFVLRDLHGHQEDKGSKYITNINTYGLGVASPSLLCVSVCVPLLLDTRNNDDTDELL
jgi:hypothetical protein